MTMGVYIQSSDALELSFPKARKKILCSLVHKQKLDHLIGYVQYIQCTLGLIFIVSSYFKHMPILLYSVNATE